MSTKFFRDLIPDDVFFYGENANAHACRVTELPIIEADGLMRVEHANGWTREKPDTLVCIKGSCGRFASFAQKHDEFRGLFLSTPPKFLE